MNITEFKEPKTDIIINSLLLEKGKKYEHYNLYINDELCGNFEKSDVRSLIESLDKNDINTTELLLNGTRYGVIPFESQKQIVTYLDNIIHH